MQKYSMNRSEIIAEIRAFLKDKQLDACIIPSTDPHMGEYIPAHWAAREWVSGFTGSAGTVVITDSFAGLWTDSRYFIQAEEQLQDCEMVLVKLKIPHTPEHLDWISENLPKNSTVAIDGKVISVSTAQQTESTLHKHGIRIDTNIDIPAKIWKNRPSLPDAKIFDHSERYAGESRKEKISRVREGLKEAKADYILVCTLDEIAWLFNLRGKDVSFNPVFVSYALVSMEGATLFIDPDKIPCELINEMQEQGIGIMNYLDIHAILSSLPETSNILLDPGKTNYSLLKSLPKKIQIQEKLGLVTCMKAVKNPVEIEGLKKVMIKDGIAWVKFLCWLEKNIGKIEISELSASNKLESLRADQDLFQGPSFYPISSFGEHGAIIHYGVTEDSDIELKINNIYLCDTGGQYLDGTTDTTRTVSLGQPTEQQKTDFTLVLKGTLGVSMLRFPAGTKGYQMDILARKALWDHELNYGHGTGHGVGFFLNVHEGPQTIGTGASGNMNTAMEPGMVTTVEPGLYRPGQYGIRTENMTLVVEDVTNDFGSFLKFETLTLVPIDTNLINKELLNPAEKEWLNSYHQIVYRKLRHGLDEDEKAWLEAKTKPI